MYAAPPVIQTEVFTTLPKELHNTEKYSPWVAERRAGKLHSFLEGPSFDREGNLWFVDIPFGRIFRITPKKDWELVTQYDGWPNGLKIHKDGSIWICDYKEGLLKLDPKTGKLETVLRTAHVLDDGGAAPRGSARRARPKRELYHRERRGRTPRVRRQPRRDGG